MHAKFWLERWEHDQIGFHRDAAHEALVRYFPRLQARPGEPVFVPLCGKSHDLEWLASHGQEVLGIELSERATRAFFDEHGRAYRERPEGSFILREDDRIRLYTGDYFALGPEHLDNCQRVYDRAALIALPPEMRQQYVRQLNRLFPGPLRLLLITMEYPQAQMQGPPFAVLEDEVKTLFEPRHRVTCLQRTDILDQEPRFRDKGLTALAESVYLIQS